MNSTTGSTAPLQDVTQHHGSRRHFLHKIGLGSLAVGLAALGFQSFRSLIPNVLYEPPQKFKIGPPGSIAEGVTFLEDRRLYVMRTGNTYSAISAACTHLGCTVRYTKLQQPKQVEIDGTVRPVPFEFHCPCHGSKFYDDGTNYAGPAPKPLRWFHLEKAPDDGQLMVDLDTEVERNFRLTV